jgi:hypothetical protein
MPGRDQACRDPVGEEVAPEEPRDGLVKMGQVGQAAAQHDDLRVQDIDDAG